MPWLLGWLTLCGLCQLLGPSPLAYAHGGIDNELDPLMAWNLNPLVSLGLFVVAYLYVNGLRKWPRPSHPVNRWQRASFFCGLLVLYLALQSPIDSLSEHFFSIHQLQHMLLRMIGPLLILLGAPLTPMLRGLPSWALKEIVRPIVKNSTARRAYQLLTNPIVTTVLFVGTLCFWQVPGPHNLAVQNTTVHYLMHLTMLCTGLLFWWLLIDPKPHTSRLHYGLRVLYVSLIVIPNTFLGASIVFSNKVLYTSYNDVTQPWNLSLLTDQKLGGLILWIPGDMMSILAAGIIMLMWSHIEENNKRTIAF
jgi:putative membrane protein